MKNTKAIQANAAAAGIQYSMDCIDKQRITAQGFNSRFDALVGVFAALAPSGGNPATDTRCANVGCNFSLKFIGDFMLSDDINAVDVALKYDSYVIARSGAWERIKRYLVLAQQTTNTKDYSEAPPSPKKGTAVPPLRNELVERRRVWHDGCL